MDKELHISIDDDYSIPYGTHTSYKKTMDAIKRGITVICTTILNFCDSKYYQLGYRIFVHFTDNTVTEICPGKVDGTDREIKLEQNWMKLLLANEFGHMEEFQ